MSDNTIAIDFDGVLHQYTHYDEPLRTSSQFVIGKPVDGAVEAWYRLYNSGYNPVVFTCRVDLKSIREWMHYHFDFERRIGHLYEPVITNMKPIARAYIDDRAIRFTNWDDVRKYFC